MNDSTRDLLGVVDEVARLAGAAALSYFRRSPEVITKADGSPVTRADSEAEATARAWITQRFPEDGIIGEEHGTTNADAARRWYIDPVDGTQSFIRGVPFWGSMIGLMEGDTIVASAIAFPAVDEFIAAARGAGCWWNGTRAQVSDTARLDRAVVLCTDPRFHGNDDQAAAWARLARRADVARTWGDCYGYLLVATGRAEVMTDGSLHPWDAVPLVPLIEEAGGVIDDWRGNPAGFGVGGIATNATLAVTARAMLRGDSMEAS